MGKALQWAGVEGLKELMKTLDLKRGGSKKDLKLRAMQWAVDNPYVLSMILSYHFHACTHHDGIDHCLAPTMPSASVTR